MQRMSMKRGDDKRKAYFLMKGMLKSLQIFLARLSFISECLGTADLLLNPGFCHHE